MVLTSPYGNVWMFTDGVMARASPKQRNKLTIQNIASINWTEIINKITCVTDVYELALAIL